MSSPNTSRSPEALRHHYEVERELATRLRNSSRAERAALYPALYNELLERVTDHPRWTRQLSQTDKVRNINAQMRLLNEWLTPSTVLVEIAPGTGGLAARAAQTAARVVGVDISDQRDPGTTFPANYEHVVFDGVTLDLPAQMADVAFSYQFLEHLHPDDVDLHFETVRRLLKPGGVYVFDTPHRYSGPHDISRGFSDELDCFHFQEWTHREMRQLLRRHGFKKTWVVRFGSTQRGWLLNTATDTLELMLKLVPTKLRRRICARLFPAVIMAAQV
jgi:cyclopropane fatty-acyl-phospholipid synthase-like methyltransferase